MNEIRTLEIARIGKLIREFRGQRVLLDADLASLYAVETGALNRAVRRNRDRFPEDFMFQLTKDEFLRCQTGISNSRGGRRYLPFVFTEQGVAMLSSVLNSARAIQVNIAIMREFVRMREGLAAKDVLAKKIAEIETKLKGQDKKFKIVFDAISQLRSSPSDKVEPKIGFGREK